MAVVEIFLGLAYLVVLVAEVLAVVQAALLYQAQPIQAAVVADRHRQALAVLAALVWLS